MKTSIFYILFIASLLERSRAAAFVPSVPSTATFVRGPRWQRHVATIEAPPDTACKSPVGLAPLADVPMHRLKLPKSAAGREYVVIQIKVNNTGPYDFMLDTGLTAELITPHLTKALDIRDTGTAVEGLTAGGKKPGAKLVELSGASLCCGKFADPDAENLPLPTLHAVVTDFPHEHIDPTHDPVEGMLGMELLELFDVDLDFSAGRIRFWAPGTAAAKAQKAGLVEIPAAVIGDTLLLGIRVTSVGQDMGSAQPLLGIIDCGSSFSAVNWTGAKLLGLPSKKLTYIGSPTIIGVSVDGKPLPLPTREVQLSFVGDMTADKDGTAKFDSPPKEWEPWEKVRVGVGDLPVFSLILGDGKTPFEAPAALIGLDVLSQRRIILETCRGVAQCSERRRRIFASPA